MPAPSPPVPTMSMAAGRRARRAVACAAHRPDGAGDLVDRFAAQPQRHQQAADLRRRGVARHDRPENAGSDSSAAQPAARRELGEKGLSSGSDWSLTPRSAAGRVRLAQGSCGAAAWPCSVAMLSGWNCTPKIGSSRCCSPWTTPSSLSAVTQQAVRASRPVDHQRVVAGGPERRREAREQAAAVVA